MAKKTRQWELTSFDDMAETTGLALWVADEMCGHWTPLSEASNRVDAIADYHADYEGDYEGELEFEWALFFDGAEINRGHATFEA